MAWQGADGPPYLAAVHQWTTAGGSRGPRLNDQGAVTPPRLPWIRVRQITGWRALPESEDNRQARTYGEGEIVYPGRKLGKTLVYECGIEAATIQTVEAVMSRTVNGFGDMSGEGGMELIPYHSSAFPRWTYRARVIDLTPEPGWDWNPGRRAVFEWGFTLSLRMSDPHFYYAGTPYL